MLVKVQHNKLNLWDVKLSETFFVCFLSRNKQSCAACSVIQKKKKRDHDLVIFFKVCKATEIYLNLNLENVFKN